MTVHLSHGEIASIYQVALDHNVHDKGIARHFDPAFEQRLLNVCNALRREGYHFDIGSGLRTLATQRIQQRHNPYAAHGLHSKHLYGCAVDLFHVRTDGHSDAQFYRALHRAARRYDLQPIHGRRERSHIQIPNHEFFAGLRSGRFRILASIRHAAHEMFSVFRHRHGHHHHRHLHSWRQAAGHTTRPHRGHHHHAHRPHHHAPALRNDQVAVPA